MKRFFLALMSIIFGAVSCSSAQTDKIIVLNNDDYAKLLSETPSIVLIDVRTAAEYNTGHLPNSINIDVSNNDFDSKVSNLDKNNIVAVYCRSGKRSNAAAKRLAAAGFSKVYDLKGGINEWQGRVIE